MQGIHKQHVQGHTAGTVVMAIDERSRVGGYARKTECNFYCGHIATLTTRTVPGRPYAGGGRKRRQAVRTAVGADGLINDPVLVVAARAAIHVFAHTLRTVVLPEISAVQQGGSILLDHDKIKIPSIGRFFNGRRRYRHPGCSAQTVRILAGKEPSAPAGN